MLLEKNYNITEGEKQVQIYLIIKSAYFFLFLIAFSRQGEYPA